MAILAECPTCKLKQSVKNKVCKCGENLDKAKRSERVRYWVSFRLPGGKQRRELVGTSIEEARAAEGKRRGQKKEGRFFEMLPASKITFNELVKWYLGIEKVKSLASYDIIKISLNKFNAVFGDMVISQIKPVDLENYQAKRLKNGKAPGTVDHEIRKAKTMIRKAFDNDLVGGDTLKAFNRIKKTLKPGSDVRDRILSHNEFIKIMNHSRGHTKAIIAMGYYTGMRKGEILNLTWDKVDIVNRMIRLEASDTKDKEARNIPICDELLKILLSIPGRVKDSTKDNHVFQYNDSAIKGDIRDGLKKACKDAGIEYGRFKKGGFIFHDLRHTFNTNMRKAGVPESVIMEITGHATRAMFDRYNTVDQDDTRKAIKNLEVFFANVDQNVDQGKKKPLRKKAEKS